MEYKKGKADSDINFDQLAPKFARKVYGGLKGDIRLAVLRKDIREFCSPALSPAEEKPLHILDAGCGHGPFSLELAQKGHHATLCDISSKMLDMAEERSKDLEFSGNVNFINCAIQDLNESHTGNYDLVMCHAVLEWVNSPKEVLPRLIKFLKPGGLLSLTFYNLNGMIFKNLLRINYKKIINEAYSGWPGSLTPPNPLMPDQVLSWLNQSGMDIVCHSGMRVFHDYILDLKDKEKKPDTVLDLELKLSRQMPFRDMGRYQHIIACRQGEKKTGMD